MIPFSHGPSPSLGATRRAGQHGTRSGADPSLLAFLAPSSPSRREPPKGKDRAAPASPGDRPRCCDSRLTRQSTAPPADPGDFCTRSPLVWASLPSANDLVEETGQPHSGGADRTQTPTGRTDQRPCRRTQTAVHPRRTHRRPRSSTRPATKPTPPDTSPDRPNLGGLSDDFLPAPSNSLTDPQVGATVLIRAPGDRGDISAFRVVPESQALKEEPWP